MARPSSSVPGYDGDTAVSGTQVGDSAYSGRPGDANDPTNEPGQYPVGGWGDAIFGGTLPTGTGAPGTQGARPSDAADPTNEPGQTQDGLTGISEHDITSTGAPGSRGARDGGISGGQAVTFTRPGSFGNGAYASDTVQADIGGPGDWTQANMDGYGSGGPKLPGMQEPQAGTGPYQPGSGGRVLRGGRDVRP